MMKRETIGEYTFEMDHVAGGMFIQVRVFKDGVRLYSFSHRTTTTAELDYQEQKDHYLPADAPQSTEARVLELVAVAEAAMNDEGVDRGYLLEGLLEALRDVTTAKPMAAIRTRLRDHYGVPA